MLMTTDTTLVQLAATGDQKAFASVYEESFACVYAFAARRTGTRAAAEALTEVILVRVFEALGSYSGDVPFAAWLHAIAKSAVPPSGPRRRPTRVTSRPPFAHSVPR